MEKIVEKMMASRKIVFPVLVLLVCCLMWDVRGAWPVDVSPAPPPAPAPQASPAAPPQESTEAADKGDLDGSATLLSIISSRDALKDQLRGLEKELRSTRADDRRAELQAAVKTLKGQMEDLEKNFEAVATGVDLTAFESPPQERFDWKREIQDLLGPIVQELKAMTARPREIERLRNEVGYCESRIAIARNAIQSVQALSDKYGDDSKLKSSLDDLEKDWKSREQQFSNRLSVAQYQLLEREREDTPFLGSIQMVLRMFFKSRGRNFILSVLAFACVFLLLRFLRRRAVKLFPVLSANKRSFFVRLADVVYQIMSIICASAALLIVLYVLGDWALLGLAILFFVGLLWTAKQAVPKFWGEYKLILNLGAVKEGERLVYNGLPWKVAAINYYTQLVNPDLSGGVMSLPLARLVDMHSRPFHPDEPWFPCKENDWVILDDGVQGKVVLQSPEMVQLVMLGGSRKTYPTEDFLKQNPKNISRSFRIGITFGLDYKHQEDITDAIPKQMLEFIKEGLEREGIGDNLVSLKVEFKEAASSSLDLLILADFAGNAANRHEALRRSLQRLAVQACNTHGWEIPFPQVTVHAARPGADVAGGDSDGEDAGD